MNKIILDLCGGTGAWSAPYAEAGYDVVLITAPAFDITKTFYDELFETLVFHGNGESLRIPAALVYGILAAPPCTMFSRARTTAKTPRDFTGAMKIVQACMEVIWRCRSAGGSQLAFWALENPMGYLRQFLGNPPHHYRGWEWGDKHVKFTDLWGYYKMPAATVKTPLKFDKKTYAAPRAPKEYAHLKLSRADIRAITPAGFARAFMSANA